MKIFLTILFTLTLSNFLYQSTNQEEFPDLRREYIMGTCFISALLFFNISFMRWANTYLITYVFTLKTIFTIYTL